MKAISASAKKDAKKKGAELLAGGPRRIEYMPLSKVIPAARNPKLHARDALDASVGRFGYTEPVLMDERTGRLVAGHGRIEALQRLQARGDRAPDGVVLQGTEWAVPVARGWSSRSDQEAEAYLLASNRLTIAGGWDEAALEQMLKELEEAQALTGVGWSPEELEKLLGPGPEGVPYSDRIETPIYKPTGEKPKARALYDTAKLKALCAEIDAAQDVPEEEREFLRMAAHRHVVFDYQGAAEFYAHASAPTQRLMENSALVIIDFKQAIEKGFVKLTQGLAEDYADDAS